MFIGGFHLTCIVFGSSASPVKFRGGSDKTKGRQESLEIRPYQNSLNIVWKLVCSGIRIRFNAWHREELRVKSLNVFRLNTTQRIVIAHRA